MNRLRVIGTDIGPNECIPYVEIVNENEEVIGTAWGKKMPIYLRRPKKRMNF